MSEKKDGSGNGSGVGGCPIGVNVLALGKAKVLPPGMSWLNEPPEWSFSSPGGLSIAPAAKTDFFRPYGDTPNDNCCLLHTLWEGDFTAVAQTSAKLCDFGDAAALTVRASAEQWAKVCLERSPKGEIAVVGVVTNPYSDDSNSELLQTQACFLRLTRKDKTFCMHWSPDGKQWRFVRMFSIPSMPNRVSVGIHGQAPFSGGCQVAFQSFSITGTAVADFRSGD